MNFEEWCKSLRERLGDIEGVVDPSIDQRLLQYALDFIFNHDDAESFLGHVTAMEEYSQRKHKNHGSRFNL